MTEKVTVEEISPKFKYGDLVKINHDFYSNLTRATIYNFQLVQDQVSQKLEILYNVEVEGKDSEGRELAPIKFGFREEDLLPLESKEKSSEV